MMCVSVCDVSSTGVWKGRLITQWCHAGQIVITPLIVLFCLRRSTGLTQVFRKNAHNTHTHTHTTLTHTHTHTHTHPLLKCLSLRAVCCVLCERSHTNTPRLFYKDHHASH